MSRLSAVDGAGYGSRRHLTTKRHLHEKDCLKATMHIFERMKILMQQDHMHSSRDFRKLFVLSLAGINDEKLNLNSQSVQGLAESPQHFCEGMSPLLRSIRESLGKTSATRLNGYMMANIRLLKLIESTNLIQESNMEP
ncbi:hypothetical protein AVEN_32043-1 [Araneus ventricosus]|uniref:Uncharacterized protein n=1 Tax=Araneus ventricosus TaxID=182803 RepID=A0A4Y2TP12_ARAVE|nr:hypothetical protein AVEN_32043-1 [Araneus ventricosus]